MNRLEDPRLLRRRQFVITSGRTEWHPGYSDDWLDTELAGGLTAGGLLIRSHPDLIVNHHSGASAEAVLLGFATDPQHPARDTQEILECVVARLETGCPPSESIVGLGGRWVLLLSRGAELLALHDPGGLRSLFYTDDTHDDLVCASEPGLIGEHLGLSTSPEAMEGFVSREVRSGVEFWWPGDSSPLRGVRRLLPNHLLDIRNRRIHRFWPSRRAIRRMPPRRALDEASELLRGQLASAAGQFELAQSITAGIDSRMVLAASRAWARDTFYYTLRYDDVDAVDLTVPPELLGRLGLEHHIIDTPSEMSEEFTEVLERSVLWPHDRWGAIVEGMLAAYPQERVAMDGTVSEVARCGYYANGELPSHVTAEYLAEMCEMSPSGFVLEQFETWMSETRTAANEAEIPLIDLFYWEQRVGSWAAAALVELDLVQETFTPFNHRELLTTLLGVDVQFRKSPRDRLPRRLVKRLWPAAASVPINPVPWPQRPRHLALLSLQVLRMDVLLRRARNRLLRRPHAPR